MILRILLILVIISFMKPNLYAQEKDELKDILEKAILYNPLLKQIKSGRDAQATLSTQNSNLPDPTIKFGLNNLPVNSFSFSQEPMTGKTIALSQGLPFPGKLKTKEELYDNLPLIEDENYKKSKFNLIADLENSYFKIIGNLDLIKIFQDKIILLDHLEEIVGVKNEVNQASLNDLYKIEFEKSLLKKKIETLKIKNNSYKEIITITSGIKELPQIEKLSLSTFVLDEPTLNDVHKYLENTPQLNAININRNISAKKKELAEYNFYPDFNFTLQYSQRDKLTNGTNLNNFLSFQVGLNLPLNYGGKTSAKVEEQKLNIAQLDQNYKSVKDILGIQIELIFSELKSIQSNKRIIEEELMRYSKESYDNIVAEYQVDEADFENLIFYINQMFMLEIELLELQKQKLNQFTMLEKTICKSLILEME